MKNMTKVVLAFALCLGLTGQAFALSHSKKQSLEVSYLSGGSYTSTLTMNGQVVSQEKDRVRGMDVNWDFHRRFCYLSWGFAARQRSVSTSRGKKDFAGLGGRVGFVTNTFEDPHRWPIGLHAYLSAVVGMMSKIDSSTYQQDALTGFSDGDLGVDVMLHGWKSADGTKYRSALVASLDTSYESAYTTLQTKDSNPTHGVLNSGGGTTKLSLSWYW